MVLLSQIQAQQKAAGVQVSTAPYNARTADANATIQQTSSNVQNLEKQQEIIQQQRQDLLAQSAAGTISTEDYNRQNSALTQSAYRVRAALQTNADTVAPATQHMNEVNSTYQNSAAGFGTTYNTKTGQTTLAGDGVIQQTAIDKIKAAHPEWTDAQVIEQLNTNMQGAQSTLSNSGQGMSYDPKTGLAIPGSEGSTGVNGVAANQSLRTNPVATSLDTQKKANEEKISSIKMYTSVPIYDKDGHITGYNKIEDPAATANAQATARLKQQELDTANANYASSRNDMSGNQNAGATQTDTPPPPNPDAFIAGLDNLEKQYAGNTMAPLFEFYKGQYAELQAKGIRGQALIDAVGKRTDEYVAQQQADMGAMSKAWTAMYDKIQDSQLESAQRTYDQQNRLAHQQKEADQVQYERAIRDQNIKNEEDRQRLLLDNGISGGWRSSMHTAKMIDAFKKAENIVADLQQNKVMNGDAWTNKLIDIEQNYHGNITAAYDAHNVSLLQLQDKLDARAQELDKTVFNSDISQLEAQSKLTEDWYAGVAQIAANTTSTVIQIQKDILDANKQAALEQNQQKSEFRQRYQFHMSTFGNNDPAGYGMLVEEAKQLGISIPATAPQTLEQKAMAMKELSEGVSSSITNTPHVVNGVDLSPIAKRIAGQQNSADKSAAAQDALFGALEKGDMNQFMNDAVSYGFERLSTAMQTDYRDAVSGLGFTADAAKYLPGLAGTNIYKTVKEMNINTALAQHKDEPWLLALGKYQLVANKILQDISGKQVTDSEAQRFYGLMAQKGDTVEDIITKLTVAHDYYQQNYDTNATVALGLGYGSAVKNGQIVNFNSTKTDSNKTDDYSDDPSMSSTGPIQFGGGNTQGHGAEGSWPPNVNTSAMSQKLSQKTGIFDWATKTLGGKWGAGYDSDHVHLALSDNGEHGGQDIPLPMGSKITPLIGGKVVSIAGSAKDKSGWGLSVTLEDDAGVFHKYSHLSNVPQYLRDALSKGQNPIVDTDTVIAYSGNSGHSTGPHLDYRARRADGKWIRIVDQYAYPPNMGNIAHNTSNNNG